MLMIEPPPALRISGMAYFAISIIEVTLTRSASFQASGSTSTALPGGPPIPTLLTRMSSRPQRDAAVADTIGARAGAGDDRHLALEALALCCRHRRLPLLMCRTPPPAPQSAARRRWCSPRRRDGRSPG